MFRRAEPDYLPQQFCAMNTSIWKRFNTTLAISISSLLIASALAVWIVHTQSRNKHVSDELRAEDIRIRYNAVVISDALRAMLLQPRDEAVLDREKQRVADAVKDLKATIISLQQNFAKRPEVSGPLTNFNNFVELTLDLHIKGTLEKIENDPAGARESFANIHAAFAQQLERQVREITNEFGDVRRQRDESSFTIAALGTVGIVLVLILSWWAYGSTSSAVAIPLKQLVDAIERMRNGDFTQRVDLKRKDEFGVLGDGLNRLADDLSVLVGQVQRSGVQVNITATQIAATSREQQSTTTEIAATTAEIGATSKQISATSRELDKTMNEVVEVAHETADLAGSGQVGISRMESTMRSIMEASGSITAKLAVLNEKTANINTVVTTITKVADQTNLLSLNAAIEAEKAGEYGLGFAVVAMEIRRLADQTAVATYDIEKMVKEMQSAVAAGVMGMDKFSEEVRRGVDEIRQVSTQLAQIIHQVQTLTPRFATVSEGMHAQATGAQQISETLTQLSEAAHQTAESLRQSNLAIEQLNEAARGLQASVARFKLEAR